jgi:methionine salvage enolase-phosphatase E1
VIKVLLPDGDIGEVNEEDFEDFRADYLKENEDPSELKTVMAELTSAIQARGEHQLLDPIKKIIVKAVKRNSLGLIQGCELEVMR